MATLALSGFIYTVKSKAHGHPKTKMKMKIVDGELFLFWGAN